MKIGLFMTPTMSLIKEIAPKNNINHEINKELRYIPILGNFFSLAVIFWASLVCFSVMCIKKSYKLLPIYIVIFAVYITYILSPVHAEMRYAYTTLFSLPVIVVFTIFEKRKNTYE